MLPNRARRRRFVVQHTWKRAPLFCGDASARSRHRPVLNAARDGAPGADIAHGMPLDRCAAHGPRTSHPRSGRLFRLLAPRARVCRRAGRARRSGRRRAARPRAQPRLGHPARPHDAADGRLAFHEGAARAAADVPGAGRAAVGGARSAARGRAARRRCPSRSGSKSCFGSRIAGARSSPRRSRTSDQSPSRAALRSTSSIGPVSSSDVSRPCARSFSHRFLREMPRSSAARARLPSHSCSACLR